MVLSRSDARLINRIRWDWVDTAWSTDPCVREQAAEFVRELYHVAGLSQPDVLWCSSPQQMVDTFEALACFDNQEEMLPIPELFSPLQLNMLSCKTRPMLGRRSVAKQLWADPWLIAQDTPVTDSVRWEVADTLMGTNALEQTVFQGGRIWGQCSESLTWAGRTPVLAAMQLTDQAVMWESYLRVVGVHDPVIAAALDVLRSVGCIAPLEGLALVAERPCFIRYDAGSHVLHALGRPAVEWDDGTGLAFWNDRVLPSTIWDWTPAEVLACPNLQLRSIAIQNMGWEPIIDSLEPWAVAEDPGNPGQVIEMYRVVVSSGFAHAPAERRQYVRVANASLDMDGTRRRFVLQVPTWIDDPVGAVAATFGVTAEVYRGLVRAC
ncbi:MAG: hypothetical protein FWD55_07930 [Propionibacteriaceae bacterium]|nr:hypothetical protein [Propionibacteriaceae bacterium]